MNTVWDFVLLMLWAFFFVAYLMVLFNVIADLFRDRELSGWLKAVWLLFLIFIPAVTALVYVIFRGRGMTERSLAAAERSREATESYIRQVATAPSPGATPAEQIAVAKSLLEDGTISADEFDVLKAKALA
ncbi:PLDc N-terminal domain-containing protein [Aeromicrobium sp.]|uniref:PLDc N-terminal domain-containing protein n=1 Tax=Aeromicrobium sp. TaxID=1871063 RepID=UPI0028A69611|nr:PLDc N-terminal domain-containing protein [Aeromicrobium sp.]